jgi:hypothetical protein
VDAAMDFGNGVTLAALKAQNSATEKQLETYNQKLSELDDLLNLLEDAEGQCTDLASRLLGGVKSKYGADSSEYEKAGGTRTSERAKPGPKKAAKQPA